MLNRSEQKPEVLVKNINLKAHSSLKENKRGTWVAQSVKHLPLAQVMISVSWDQTPRQALCSAGSLLRPSTSHSPSVLFLSLSLSLK